MAQTEQTAIPLRTASDDPIPNRLHRAVEYGRRYRRLHINLSRQHLILPNSRARAADPANRTDFLMNYPGSPSSIDGLVRWLPILHALRESASVSILVGDICAYRAVRQATDLPCYFGRVASEAEYVAQQLQTKVMLYVNQSKLNLREAGFHDMLHVFLGAPGRSRRRWLSNRMRLYDYVLVPDEESRGWLASRLMSFNVEARVRVIGRRTEETVLDRFESRVLPNTVVDHGVDPAAVVRELLQIRDERDRLVADRDAALAERGIVLVKGGQA